jgi:tetratricopeptide (TPR) repeat protein
MKMKKLLLIILLSGLVTGLHAQNKNVVSAFNYLKRDRLDKAKEAIDPATTHEKTMNDPKTWFYSGNVYLALFLTEEEEYKGLHPNPLDKALSDYRKSLELDTKEAYTKEVNERILFAASKYFEMGVKAYNDQDYKKSSDAFAQAAEISRGYQMIDTVAIFYAAQGAYLSNDFDRASGFFDELMQLKFQEPGIYRMMADIQKSKGDTTMAITTINKGRKLYPNDFNLIVDAANIYLITGRNEEALDVLELAMQQDETNPTLFFAAGTIYDKIQDREKAIQLYDQAIKIDPEYFDANYNLGALYYNQAAELITEATNLPLNETEKYDKLLEEGNEMMKKSLPYLEKADQIQPGDPTTLQTLKEIYTRLNMLEKLKGINERINE